jgi:hypothetical protein
MTPLSADILRDHLGPDFESTYLDLVSIYGDDLSDEILLEELADYLSDAVMSPFADDAVIERCCSALDALCLSPNIDGVSMVYGQVLRALAPAVLERAQSYFGPATEAMLDKVNALEA